LLKACRAEEARYPPPLYARERAAPYRAANSGLSRWSTPKMTTEKTQERGVGSRVKASALKTSSSASGAKTTVVSQGGRCVGMPTVA